MKSLSRVGLFATPWTIAYQASPSMGFSRQEYWSRLPFPSPGGFPNPGIKPGSPSLQADALPSEPPGKPHCVWRYVIISQTLSKPGSLKLYNYNLPWRLFLTVNRLKPIQCFPKLQMINTTSLSIFFFFLEQGKRKEVFHSR